MNWPNPDFPEHDPRAWLDGIERRIYEAHRNEDLSANLTISVCLREHRNPDGTKKRVSRKSLTPEQEERESVAGTQISAWGRGALNAEEWLFRLAGTRRELHYAKRGETPPKREEA